VPILRLGGSRLYILYQHTLTISCGSRRCVMMRDAMERARLREEAKKSLRQAHFKAR
jgi:hypothetical protein